MTEQPVERVMMSGSGPRWTAWNGYTLLLGLYAGIRKRIEALPETISREEMLKILDEYKPNEPKGGLPGPLSEDLP